MHVHHANQPVPMQQLVETRQSPAAKEAEMRRKISLFLVGGGEESEERGSARREREESPQRREEAEDGEFAHTFSVVV
jgi:hypothetical protein